MLLIRLLIVLTAIFVAGSVLAFLLTRNQKYLDFAWRSFRYALIVGVVFFGLLIIERIAIIP